MPLRVVELLKKWFTTTTDHEDVALGAERIDEAKKEVEETLQLLELRRQNLTMSSRRRAIK
jgi:hypothetical protein